MLGRGGVWSTQLASLIGSTDARYWFYQDFSAGAGTSITLTANSNGTGGATWSASRIVDNSAVITDTDNQEVSSAAAADPAQLITATNSGASVTTSAAVHSSFGSVR